MPRNPGAVAFPAGSEAPGGARGAPPRALEDADAGRGEADLHAWPGIRLG
ncbi:hypothetical protein [Candidatus Thiodictyon syntrophicum]|nr:hypothetical protein [Candidatus Thiodictyon syntrophicum]